MLWQEIIFNRLNIEQCSKTIIIDRIGLLHEPSFTEYLSARNCAFTLSDDVATILKALQTSKLVIVSAQTTLPAYLENQAAVIHFDIRKLPVEIEPSLLDKLLPMQIIDLIKYLNDTGILQLVDKNNYQRLLKKAKLHFVQKELYSLKVKITMKTQAIHGYSDILELGRLWGRYTSLSMQYEKIPDIELMQKIDQSTEKPILDGIVRNAFYETTAAFKTVNKIIPYIKSRKPDKFALVCFDAMGAAEWYLLKNYLADSGFHFNERYIFALIPTITTISRSAVFYGNAEKVYELKSVNEDKAFADNFPQYTVRSFKEGELTDSNQLLGISAVKIIYNVFDDLAHKTVLPVKENRKTIYFKNVKNYLLRSKIKEELKLLFSQGFKLWFCSDHGSVAAVGNGYKIDKYLIEKSAKRAAIIEKSELAKFYDVNQYEIPFVKNLLVLLAKKRTSFSHKGKTEIVHGGITLDELIVPFVEVID